MDKRIMISVVLVISVLLFFVFFRCGRKTENMETGKIKKRVMKEDYDKEKNDILNDGYIIIYSLVKDDYVVIYAVKEEQYRNETITFVIQGKRGPNFEVLLDICFSYGIFVDSTWKGDDDPDFLNVTDDIKKNNYPNEANIYFQVYSTLKGLDSVTTKYSIKCRGDEYYKNLDLFIDEIKNNNEKIVVNNVHLVKTENIPFHISDHLIGGTTENLKIMFSESINFLKNKRKLAAPNEQHLTMSYLYGKGINYIEEEIQLPIDEIKKIMENHFIIIPVNKLGEYEVTFGKKIYKDVSSDGCCQIEHF